MKRSRVVQQENTDYSKFNAVNCTEYDPEFPGHNVHMIHEEISAKAKVLLFLLLEKDVHEDYTQVFKYFKEGRDAMNCALNELVDFGYVMRLRYRAGGRLKGSILLYTGNLMYGITLPKDFEDYIKTKEVVNAVTLEPVTF